MLNVFFCCKDDDCVIMLYSGLVNITSVVSVKAHSLTHKTLEAT